LNACSGFAIWPNARLYYNSCTFAFQILAWKTAYLAQIDSLDTLTQLVNQLLTAETLAEFEQKLLGYLPKDKAQT